jgi:hypothetical protein
MEAARRLQADLLQALPRVASVLARSQAVMLASAAAIGLHAALALRRVFGRSWSGTVWRWVLPATQRAPGLPLHGANPCGTY